jgi:hypothetical protein
MMQFKGEDSDQINEGEIEDDGDRNSCIYDIHSVGSLDSYGTLLQVYIYICMYVYVLCMYICKYICLYIYM